MTDILRAANVWKFGDNMDTDLMMPADVLWGTQRERARAVFRANRPGWVDEVQEGDAIIAGRNFGMGSSRPAALSIKQCGVGFVLAESINGLFFRNAVNYGLLAFQCPGVSSAFEEGDAAQVSVKEWTVTNLRSGDVLKVVSIPDVLFSLMSHGGVVSFMERQGMIATPAT